MTRLLRPSLTCGLLLTALAVTVQAAEAPSVRSLRGLTDLQLVVNEVGVLAEQRGLRRADLINDATHRLQSAGLRVLAANERSRGMPRLVINLKALPIPAQSLEMFAYSLDVTLYQETRLVRDPSVRVSAATWQTTGAVGAIEASLLAELRGVANHHVDTFLATWRAANRQ